MKIQLLMSPEEFELLPETFIPQIIGITPILGGYQVTFESSNNELDMANSLGPAEVVLYHYLMEEHYKCQAINIALTC